MSLSKVTTREPGSALPAGETVAAPIETTAFGVRRFGRVNWLGLWTLFKKEVWRYLKVAFQTVLAPVISTLLFLAVFVAAWGDRPPIDVGGVLIPFLAFLPPGLIMMGLLNNAFQNSSSSLIIAKVQGNLVDVLMPPLSAAELTAAFVAGAATRGLLVGAVTAIATYAFVWGVAPPTVAHLWAIVYFSISGALLLGMAGVVAGVWAEKFDQLAAVTNFIVTPLTMLSGTFFSLSSPMIPDFVRTASAFNPFFYLIDGFRYGFLGASDTPIGRAAVVIFCLNVAAAYLCYRLFKSGWKLKS